MASSSGLPFILRKDYTRLKNVSGGSLANGDVVVFTPRTMSAIDLESGSTQFLSIADASQTGLDFSTTLTLEAWIKLETQPGADTNYAIMTKYEQTSDQRSYEFMWRTAGGTNKFFFTVSSAGTDATKANITSDDLVLNTGTWYHVAVTYSSTAGEVKFYVDGVQSGATKSASTAMFNSTAPFAIGVTDATESYFDGVVDDARAWSIVRTSAQILANMTREIDTETGLQGSWHLNDTLTDSSGNGNTLTNNGAAVFVAGATGLFTESDLDATTTTTGGDDKVFGIAAETIANSAYGRFQIAGKTTALKVDGTTDIAAGDLLSTFTTAKIAKKASAGDMCFAVALEAYTANDSSGVIDAVLLPWRTII